MGPDAMILVFWILSFKPTSSLSFFTFIKRLFSSSSLSAIRVVPSAYLRLLIFLPVSDKGDKVIRNDKVIGNHLHFSSVTQSRPTFCDPMNCSTPGLPVHYHLLEFTQTHVHQVDDAIQPSHSLSSPSSLALNPSQHQGLFQWVNSSDEVVKVLEFQLQHQSFQWTTRTDLL